MKYFALLAVVAAAYAAQPEVQPVVLPEPALPYVKAPQDNAFGVRVVEAPVEMIKTKMPVPDDLMKKVIEATNYVFTKHEAAPEAKTVERVQVVDAPIDTTFDRVKVVDQVVETSVAETIEKVQIVDAPVETPFDRVQVVDEVVLTPVKLETPVERVQVVDTPILNQPIYGRWPGKVYPNPLLRGKH